MGVFSSEETCWWLPLADDPADWLVVLCGNGVQQLNITTTEFLDAWLHGRLDLPVLSLPPVPLERTLTRAGDPVPAVDLRISPRDSLAQLRTLTGSGTGPQEFDWDAIAEELGVPGLPSDYKRLHEEYGSNVALNGIFVAGPLELASLHQTFAEYLPNWSQHWDTPPGTDPEHVHSVHHDSGGLVFCGSTEGRDTLCWDTRDPDPDRWSVVGDGGTSSTLTELLVAELTGNGLGLPHSGLGDPDNWAWPFQGQRGRGRHSR
ncbi:SMI1/KNR4 family protein [Actinomadura welshii]|uniref:SMI1/KNR4 family protein n=1 Tax=Actinomadura welshii TaxID=3103817 RepID=UPI0004145B8B|nr:SMI1/KNR4 family protein [Actinomadura madurae]